MPTGHAVVLSSSAKQSELAYCKRPKNRLLTSTAASSVNQFSAIAPPARAEPAVHARYSSALLALAAPFLPINPTIALARV